MAGLRHFLFIPKSASVSQPRCLEDSSGTQKKKKKKKKKKKEEEEEEKKKKKKKKFVCLVRCLRTNLER